MMDLTLCDAVSP